MASLAKTYTREKLNGQIYTPAYIVDKILDEIGYNNERAATKRILDPACGDGRFLVEVARRIIQYSKPKQLKQHLENLHGWDIDPAAIDLAIQNLDLLVQPLGICVEWNVKVCNALLELPAHKLSESSAPLFHFIVGNPPYIRIQHLEAQQRKYLQTNYQFCKSGSTDIYLAFFELADALLSADGTCGFITPNTYFYTETAKPLRQFFAQQQNLVKITNYADIQVFDNVSTYTAITIFTKQQQPGFVFEKATSAATFQTRAYSFDNIQNNTWQLSSEEIEQVQGELLGRAAKIHVGITTLCDKAYIFPVEKENDQHIWVRSRLKALVQLEKDIVKPIIKASTCKNGQEPLTEVVLFPYKKINGKHQIIPEKELADTYPLACQYLQSVRIELDKRDNGKPNKVAWYAFGRSQGLDTSFGRKVLFSPMNLRPKFILSNYEEATFYSGYCIKYPGDYNKLLEQLNSERMQKFVEVSCRDFRGGWKAYNKKTLENFVLAE